MADQFGGFAPGAPPAMGSFQPGTVATATSVVELSISGRDLRDMDLFSKSDPMCVVFIRPFGAGPGQWIEVQRTEGIQNTLNPDFATKVKMNYLFEEQQHLKFEMYDLDSRSPHLGDHDFIGSCQCTLAQLVTSGTMKMELQAPVTQNDVDSSGRRTGTNGRVLVTCEELSAIKDEIELQLMGKKLDKKDWFGSSDPFLEFSRSNENMSYTLVHRTPHINNNVNPVWEKFTIPVRTLCNGDYDRNIRVQCFDHNNSGSHSLIGEFYLTVRQLMQGPCEQNVFECINPKKKMKKSSYKNSGKIHLIHYDMRKAYSFVDYIRGGTELACTISIDFTGSNGDPQNPQSLHHIDPSGRRKNQYELALSAVGEIIEEYDSDKLFPVLGFGARLPPDGRVSHAFYVNGHPDNPYCQQVQGVLSAYQSCIRRVQLYGPTNFAPSIQHVANIARQFTDGSQYFILLILTDGIITDMPQTKTAIVSASTLPLSIIIVGVGGADFEAMEELDGDTVRLTDPSGKPAARDIVQFVPFQNFIGGRNVNMNTARLQLAREVLAEIPDQFIGYMKANRIEPKPPRYGADTVAAMPGDPERFQF